MAVDLVRELLGTGSERNPRAAASRASLVAAAERRLKQLAGAKLPSRLWEHDAALWTSDPTGQEEVLRRLGWMDSPLKARARLRSYREFASELSDQGIRRFLVLGMGGSSLAPEVFSESFGANSPADPASARLAILDSTDPEQIAASARDFPPEKSLYLVSSKSGGTAEVSAALDYFWALSGGRASNFAAVSDEGTPLQALARERGFRRAFTADSAVGGRFSALTDFGLVPAALLGLDLDRLLEKAAAMRLACGPEVEAEKNPGIVFGAILGEAALAGRDKLTILADFALQAFPSWIEQLVAESSGKDGKGILPVALEPLDGPEVYGDDRLFIYLRRNGDLANGLEALRDAGQPVITFDVPSAYDLGAEFFRWELAVAVACHVIGVNAFDQPDVQESKDRTRAKIAQFREEGRLQEGAWDIDLADSRAAPAARARVQDFLAGARPRDYVALTAYLPRNQETISELQRLRVLFRERTRCAVTAGFGPRFQHSTGQFHKGGPNTGFFVQIVSDSPLDLEIPGEGMSFGTLLRAQALGDYETLLARGRRVVRVHLAGPGDLQSIRKVLG